MILLYVVGALSALSVATPQRRYYSLHNMPDTNFDCRDKILGGYYADPEANCQMFHVCVKIPGQGVQDFRFLCPNETSFDQENQICADSGDIDCEAAGLYVENFDLYRIGSGGQPKKPIFSSSKGTVVPLGPSTKSPLLTNNINEDDELFLQRGDTGDRRLHTKDLLRGSSSSNFFNNRNKGKDLDDDEDDEPVPNAPQQYRPKPQQHHRGKSQYSSHFRSPAPTQATSTTTTTTTTTTPPPPPQQQQQPVEQERKRTKIAVRKLARKRPAEPTQTSPTPNYSTFTTQVTQKFNFGEGQRYNTINRSPSTTNARQSSTLAFFEPNPTTRPDTEGTPVSLNKQPIVAAAPSYQQNQNRPQNRPQPAGQFRQPALGNNQNFQQQPNRPTPATQNFQQNRPAQGNQNFQQNRPAPNNQNFQQQQENRPATTNQNFQQPQNRPAPVNQNFQQQQQQQFRPSTQSNNQQPIRQSTPNNQNLQQQSRPSTPFNNQNRNNGPQSRPTTPPAAAFNTRAQTINSGLEGRPTVPPSAIRQQHNRNQDDFEDNDQQEFLKTAPSNNFRPSDLNSFQNTYKTDNFEKNATKFAPTTKYYTPTIVTTPKAQPTRPPSDYQTTRFVATNPPSPTTNFYTPTSSTTKFYNSPSSTLTPPTSGPQPRPFSTTPNQPSQPSQPIQPNQPNQKPSTSKDASYDYAYYDDGGAFSEYDSLDPLGESDFSRTSQRAKSRLI